MDAEWRVHRVRWNALARIWGDLGPNVHIVDVKTSQVSDLPESEKSFFVPGALRTGVTLPLLCRLYQTDAVRHGKEKWTQLRGFRFGFENWSHDGKYLLCRGLSEKVDDLV